MIHNHHCVQTQSSLCTIQDQIKWWLTIFYFKHLLQNRNIVIVVRQNRLFKDNPRKSINTCDAIKQRYIHNIWSTVKIAGSSGGS